MKKLIISSIIGLFSLSANAQLFSGTKTQSNGEISVGVHPTIIDGNIGVYLRGTIGTTHNMDVNLNVGILEGNNFIGVDVKKPFHIENIDIAAKAGIHMYGSKFGVDASIIGSIDIDNDLTFFSGLDSDIYGSNGLKIDFWLPIGIEFKFHPKLTLVGELNLAINERAFNIWQTGLKFYL